MAWFWRKKEAAGHSARPALTPSLEKVAAWIEHKKPALLPCLTEREVLTFEEVNRMQVPAEYRTFLTTICEGGEFGPEYALLPLGAVH